VRTFQLAAGSLLAAEQRAARSHARRSGADERFEGLEPDLLAGVTGALLVDLVRAALAAKPLPVVDSSHVHSDEISVGETLLELTRTLPTIGRTTLRSLTGAAGAGEIVACFLALLELFKRELVELSQAVTFGELEVTWTGGGGDVEIGLLDDYDQLDTSAHRGRR